MAGFARDYPDIRVDVICQTSTQLYADLLQGKLDIAICTALGVSGEKIYQEPVVWVAGATIDLLKKESLPLAVYGHDCIYRKWSTEALEEINRPFHVAYMSPSISGILAAVRSGLAVAPVGLSVAGEDTQIIGSEEGLPLLPAADVCMYRNGDVKNPLADKLAIHVRKSFYQRKKQRA